MKRKFGSFFMCLGAALVLAALALFLYNQQEAQQAQKEANHQLSLLVEQIGQQETEAGDDLLSWTPVEFLTEEDKKMTEVIIDGYAYIGYLTIPSLELELPVMSTWSSKQLQKAPCRYTGTVLGRDLVIMAHNFSKHFGTISKMKEGDSVIFTDMDGVVTQYEVVAQDILQPLEVEEMIAGEYDLTLFTCTYGGHSRVTVRCDRVAYDS